MRFLKLNPQRGKPDCLAFLFLNFSDPKHQLKKPAAGQLQRELDKLLDSLRVIGPKIDRRKKSLPLLLANVGQLVTLPRSSLTAPLRGRELSQLQIVEDGAVLCVGGKIVSAGRTKDALKDPWLKKNRGRILEIDCAGKVVLPGFVDSHTHPVFVGPRLIDFEKRIEGASYEQITAAGGGIRSSIKAVQSAEKSELTKNLLAVLLDMTKHGTTTVEAKSGYGLTVDSEIKSLEAIREAASVWPGTVISTLLGAHVVPKRFESSSQKYVELVCNQMIPLAAKKKLAHFVDVFCDRGAFSADETEEVFEAATRYGLQVRAHMGQLSPTSLAPFLRFHPASFDHLDHLSDDDVTVLAEHDTVATLVPGANYFLGMKEYPNARKLIDSRVPVALATDYNPGTSPTLSMPMAMSLACTHMKMTPAEAIAAATINGAWALRVADRKGSITPGQDADMAIFDVKDYREISYWFGSNRCERTIIAGEIVLGQ